MAIRRLDTGNKFSRHDRRSVATVSTLPTVKAMVDCFKKYLNLTIANGHASDDIFNKLFPNHFFVKEILFSNR